MVKTLLQLTSIAISFAQDFDDGSSLVQLGGTKCFKAEVGDISPMQGSFTADDGTVHRDVQIGEEAKVTGKFCTSSALVQRSRSALVSAELDGAMVQKGAEQVAEKVAENIFEFVVEYPVLEDCSMAPTNQIAYLDALTGVGSRVPCGEGIQFHVVLVPCPADLNDPDCWDPISSAGGDIPRCTDDPVGGCLPAMQTKKGFSTGPVSLPQSKGRYALASVYWANTNAPQGMWVQQMDLAQRIPLDLNGTFKLSPHFLPAGSGRLSEIKDVSMAQFGQGTVQNIGVYEPPSCVENPTSCSKAKVVIVLDGPVPVPPLLAQSADDLIRFRRSNSFIMIFVPSSFRRVNETDAWPCARNAMLTPVPCVNGPCCDGASGSGSGQNDALFDYIGETLLPLLSSRIKNAGQGQKAGIVGYSLGGLTSCNAAWVRPDLFDAAGCSSPSMWWRETNSSGDVYGSCGDTASSATLKDTYFRSAMAKYPVPTAKLYVSHGTSESCMGGSQNVPGPVTLVVQEMRKAGVVNLVFEENTGYIHDGISAFFMTAFWRALEVIVPNESHLAVSLM